MRRELARLLPNLAFLALLLGGQRLLSGRQQLDEALASAPDTPLVSEAAWVARRFPRPNIAYRPVPGLPPARLAVAWLSESRSPAVAAFVRTARDIAAAATPVPQLDPPITGRR